MKLTDILEFGRDKIVVKTRIQNGKYVHRVDRSYGKDADSVLSSPIVQRIMEDHIRSLETFTTECPNSHIETTMDYRTIYLFGKLIKEKAENRREVYGPK